MFENNGLGITESDSVLGAFVGGVGFKFGAIGGASSLDFGGFFLGEFGLGSGLILRSVEFRFFLPLFLLGVFFLFFREFGFRSGVNFLWFVFLEFGAAGMSIGFRVIGSFLVFCFGKFGGQRYGLLFAQIDVIARGPGL